MTAAIDAVLAPSAKGSDRASLALAILASLLLAIGLQVWGGRYESALFLLPLLGCGLATASIVMALQWQQAHARRSLADRAAIAIGCLALVGPGMTLFFLEESPWILVPACLLTLSIFLLPARSAPPGLPLILGLVSISTWLAFLGGISLIRKANAFEALTAVTLACQVLALLGLQRGSASLARGARMEGRLGLGIAINTILLLAPLVFSILALASDD